MTAQQLKNSILQMAVQGKLVPQDSNDEPASVLLERIRAEKEALIKAGKIKREKNPSVIFRGADNLPYEKCGGEVRCIADEVPFDIPDTWEWVRLKQVATTELGKTLDKAKNKGEYRPYLCSINVYWDGIDLTSVKEARFEDSELSKYLLHKGDLLICEGGDVGRSAIWDGDSPMYYQNALHRVRFRGNIESRYFLLLLEAYKGLGILDGYSKGMTIKHLVQNSLLSICFPLPPLSEQRRIVNAVNELRPALEAYASKETELRSLSSTFPSQLKKSILQMAVQGKLVPQDPADEPASVLLERIREEKARLVKEGKIKRDKHESVIFRRDNSHYEKLDGVERCIDDEIPFEIPDSWRWVRLNSVVTFENGDRSSKYPVESDYVPFGIPFWGARDMVNNTLTPSLELRYISKSKYDSLGNGKLLDGDFVCLLRGAVGKWAAFQKCDAWDTGFINAQMVILRSIAPFLGNYLGFYLSTPLFETQVKQFTTGTAVAQMSAKDMMQFLMPLPPSTEQTRIIAYAQKALSAL